MQPLRDRPLWRLATAKELGRPRGGRGESSGLEAEPWVRDIYLLGFGVTLRLQAGKLEWWAGSMHREGSCGVLEGEAHVFMLYLDLLGQCLSTRRFQ